MFISKGYKGNYYLYFKQANGKLSKVSCKTKLKKEANEFLRNFTTNNSTKTVKNEVVYLDNFIKEVTRYITDNYRLSTQGIYKYALKTLIEIIGNKPILLITSNDIEKYRSERTKVVNRTTANIYFNTIKASFNLAVKWKLIYENPCKDLKQYKIDEKEILCFPDEEIALLINSIDDIKLQRIVKFALYSGCRISEIINLEWKDLDFNERVIFIRNKEGFATKSGKIRKIPFANKTLEIISEMQNEKSKVVNINYDYLFTNKNGVKYDRSRLTRHFKFYIRKIGLSEKYHFHCLRHTFITNLIKAGVNINFVKELAGHSDINTTMNYIHIVTEDLREAVNKI